MPPNPTSRRAVLGILIFGFTLVMILLFAAGAAAITNTRLIQSAALDLAREQSLSARLVDEIQREHSFVNRLLQHLRRPVRTSRADLLGELLEVERRFNTVVGEATELGTRRDWQRTASAAQSFCREARRVLSSPNLESVELETLWARHEELLAQVVRLVESSSTRVASVERQLQAQSHSMHRQSMIFLGLSGLAAFACAVLTIWLVGRSFSRLAEQESELARVSFHLMQAQEESAQRFSHELHDEMGQVLSAFKANLVTMDAENLDERRKDCLQLTDHALTSVRELSQLLRPVILDDFGLEAALGWLTDRFSARTGINVSYKSTGASRLPAETETHLFRIAQEALTNIARHSKASEVSVSYAQSGTQATLKIDDNGIGLAPSASRPGGFGLTGMRARARHIGGELKLRSRNGEGFHVEVRVPIAEGRP